MLQFKLGVERDPVVVLVVDEEHEAVEVDGVVRIFVEVRVQLAVAADGGLFPPAAKGGAFLDGQQFASSCA